MFELGFNDTIILEEFHDKSITINVLKEPKLFACHFSNSVSIYRERKQIITYEVMKDIACKYTNVFLYWMSFARFVLIATSICIMAIINSFY